MREVRRLRVTTRRRVDGLLTGGWRSAFRGQGIEFSEVREYEPGDDVRSIDWNVTARTGRPFIKRFVEERQLTVVYAFDASGSSVFGSVGRSKARLMAETGAVIAAAAMANRDRVGLMRFSDEVDLYLPPGRGPRHQQRVMRELLSVEPAGRGLAIAGAVEGLGGMLERHAVVFIASDFMLPEEAGLEERFELGLKRLVRRHEVIALRVSDRREGEVPAIGLVRFMDPETGRAVLVDTSSRGVREGLRRRAMDRRERTERVMRRCGVELVELATDRPFVRDLLAAMRARERRR